MRHSGKLLSAFSPAVQAQVTAALHPPGHAKAPRIDDLTPVGVLGGMQTPAPGKGRIRQNAAGLNRTEAAFLLHLQSNVCPSATIYPQAITLQLANGLRYTPDFVSVTYAFTPESILSEWRAWEVKGFARDDAVAKLKMAARVFPAITFHLVTKLPKKQGGGWSIQRVLS